MKHVATASAPSQLLVDILQLIEQNRKQLFAAVNGALIMLYWHIGHRIRSEEMQAKLHEAIAFSRARLERRWEDA